MGFGALLWTMALIAACTTLVVTLLPGQGIVEAATGD
jgi:hypothetical protein